MSEAIFVSFEPEACLCVLGVMLYIYDAFFYVFEHIYLVFHLWRIYVNHSKTLREGKEVVKFTRGYMRTNKTHIAPTGNTVQPVYKVVRIQGMSAYSVRFPGPDSCVCNCDETFIHIRNPLIRNFCF